MGGVESQAIHPRIELEPGVDRSVAAAVQQVDLFDTMDDGLESVLHCAREFGRVHHAREQDDALRDPVVAQLECFGHTRDRECVHLGQVPGDRHHAMSIGIGLDDRHHFRARSGCADNVEVVFQCAEPDQCSCPETH